MADLRQKANEINELLRHYLPAETKEFGDITEAMNYSVLSGGKRLRAIMLIEAFRLFNGDKDMEKRLACPFAAAMECVQAYSLVHDDLPAMDNDLFRRGLPTTHSKFGHAMGILAGDALLNYSMEIIADAMTDISSVRGDFAVELYSRAARAASYFYKKTGFSGMIGGQVLDINGPERGTISENSIIKLKLQKIYELKTAALFRASLCMGAILAGATDDEIKLMDSLGYQIGLSFQIMDDILDETATFEQLGKDTKSDDKNNKETFASAFGIEASKAMLSERLDTAADIIAKLPGNTDFFKEYIDYLRIREN